MAADIQDWTAAVVVTGGTVSISGTATVSISGTPTVNIAAGQSVSISGTPTVNIGNTPSVSISGTPAVTITSGNVTATISGTPNVNIASQSGNVNVAIAGTPAVTISGSPTVILGGGSASIGSVSAINSTVTVAGTVSISGTPTVTISGTVSVSIVSGSVSISGTAAVSITAQTVALSIYEPQTSLGNFVVAFNSANNAVYNVPTGTHALGIAVPGPGLDLLQVTGITTGIDYIRLTPGNLKGYFVSPVLSVLDTQVRVSAQTNISGIGPTTVYSVAILDAEGVFIFDNAKEPAGVFVTDPAGQAWGTAGYTGGQRVAAQAPPVVLASDQMPLLLATYRTSHNYAPAVAGFTLVMIGSNTKLVKVWRIRIGIAAAASVQNLMRLLRIQTPTVGTIAFTAPPVPGLAAMYLPDPVPTAVIREYSVVPAFANTAEIGQLRTLAPTGAVLTNWNEWKFGEGPGRKPLTLNGATDGWAIDTAGLNGVTWEVEWTEE